MMMKNLAAALLFLALAAASGMAAGDIYKWTDEDGNVHYGDRPVGAAAATAETIAVTSRPTNSQAVQARVDSRQERQSAQNEERTAREQAEAEEAEARKAAEDTAKVCAQYRSRLETYVTSRRLYKLDDQGERVYLDESAIQAARSELQQRIQENCSGQQ